ncbi:MAG TPA: ABC transporter permease subunit [Methanocella sp.]|nr:ABC transporter permease subunit [Methanocella sp.]
MASTSTRPEIIVAVKEFKDYLNSKRFLFVFGFLAILTIIGAITGFIDYNSALTTYNSNLQSINSTANIAGRMVRMVEDVPSMLTIFQSYSTYIASVGAFLAICMGFDMITREKEEGTLKLLLTHPVFRDSVINGKLLGAGTMLLLVMASTFLMTIAIMLFFGVMPGSDDLTRIGALFLMTILFMFTWLAIAVTCSTISPNSAIALTVALFLLMLSAVVPDISSTVSSAIAGTAPEMMIPASANSTSSSSVSDSGGNRMFTNGGGPSFESNGTRMTINPDYQAYVSNRNNIENIMNVISPTYNYGVISQVVNEKLSAPRSSTSGNVGFYQQSVDQSVSVITSLSSVLLNILAMLVMIIVGFAVSYVKFIRVDVR